MTKYFGISVRKTTLRALLLMTVCSSVYVMYHIGPVVLHQRASVVRNVTIDQKIQELKANFYDNLAELVETGLGIVLVNGLVTVFCTPNYMLAEPAWLAVMFIPSLVAWTIGALVYIVMAGNTHLNILARMSEITLSPSEQMYISSM